MIFLCAMTRCCKWDMHYENQLRMKTFFSLLARYHSALLKKLLEIKYLRDLEVCGKNEHFASNNAKTERNATHFPVKWKLISVSPDS